MRLHRWQYELKFDKSNIADMVTAQFEMRGVIPAAGRDAMWRWLQSQMIWPGEWIARIRCRSSWSEWRRFVVGRRET